MIVVVVTAGLKHFSVVADVVRSHARGARHIHMKRDNKESLNCHFPKKKKKKINK
jgi:hypothetical protein